MNKDAGIYIAGHLGLAGSAIVRKLRAAGFGNLIVRTHAELDLCSQAGVDAFFASEQPDYVFLAAARVGGIHANNSYPADFISDNLQIQSNVIDAARRHGVTKLLFLGSSCIYPRDCPQPMKEEYLLTGPLEPTNEWYAVAKIAGIKLCQASRRQHGFDAISVMPTNLYGPGDNYDLQTSHVMGALLRKFREAVKHGSETVEIWGTGTPLREFMHVDDLASACVFLMNNYSDEQIINVGSGVELSISALAELIAGVAGFNGRIVYNPDYPDGTPRKLLDTSKLAALGWHPEVSLADGVAKTLQNFPELT